MRQKFRVYKMPSLPLISLETLPKFTPLHVFSNIHIPSIFHNHPAIKITSPITFLFSLRYPPITSFSYPKGA